jgi:E1-E2 ATPase
VVGKIVYLRRSYHFGPNKIAMYSKALPRRGDQPSGVWRILKRLEMSRLPELPALPAARRPVEALREATAWAPGPDRCQVHRPAEGVAEATTFFVEGEGFYWELATLVDVMLLGHWIEMRSIGRAGAALAELAPLLPDTAEMVVDGEIKEVPISDLSPGDTVRIRPGARVPTDGAVIEGSSHVNEAMLTGESRPVGKGPGAHVIAGTVNEKGALRAKVTLRGGPTRLDVDPYSY